jgi:hypothetical protein
MMIGRISAPAAVMSEIASDSQKSFRYGLTNGQSRFMRRAS